MKEFRRKHVVIFSLKEKLNFVICRKIDGTGGHPQLACLHLFEESRLKMMMMSVVMMMII
jgi:hypothetical protein